MSSTLKFGKYLKSLFLLGDYIALNLAFICTFFALGGEHWEHPKWIWLALNVAFTPSEYLFPAAGTLRVTYIDRTILTMVKMVVMWMPLFLMLLYVMDLFDVEVWQWLTLAALSFLFMSVWHIGVHIVLKKVRRMGFNYQRIIIIGSGRTARALQKELESDTGFGYRLMGYFDDNSEDTIQCSYHGSFSDIEPFVRRNSIDVIYYTLDAEDHERMASVVTLADELGVSFVYVPRFSRHVGIQFTPARLGNIPVMEHTFNSLRRPLNRLVKRGLDLSISVPFLIVSPLIFIPIAIAVKITSPGPVFFKQRRTGIHGHDFVCYKFRTMRVNAEADSLQATENDPRKTRFGDFLRRSSLDELPQFFNVLIGNMSVVGPRPHMVSHTEEYMQLIDKYMIRHAVKPGITGWAQVNGYRGGTKHLWQMEKRVDYDVWYITNWNIFLDIKIIFMTIFNAFRGDKNAY